MLADAAPSTIDAVASCAAPPDASLNDTAPVVGPATSADAARASPTFTVVAPVDSIEEALRLSNDTVLGLTAGFYSEDRAEIDRFLEGIEAGVVYVNRRAGATTGAWPGIQPFGGWKGSTATGKAGGGFYYVQQFMREQSQTIVD